MQKLTGELSALNQRCAQLEQEGRLALERAEAAEADRKRYGTDPESGSFTFRPTFMWATGHRPQMLSQQSRGRFAPRCAYS